jgi:hypothetical protein
MEIKASKTPTTKAQLLATHNTWLRVLGISLECLEAGIRQLCNAAIPLKMSRHHFCASQLDVNSAGSLHYGAQTGESAMSGICIM